MGKERDRLIMVKSSINGLVTGQFRIKSGPYMKFYTRQLSQFAAENLRCSMLGTHGKVS